MHYRTFIEELTETRNVIEQLHYHISTELENGLYDNPDEIRSVRATMRLAEGRLRALSEALRVETSTEG